MGDVNNSCILCGAIADEKFLLVANLDEAKFANWWLENFDVEIEKSVLQDKSGRVCKFCIQDARNPLFLPKIAALGCIASSNSDSVKRKNPIDWWTVSSCDSSEHCQGIEKKCSVVLESFEEDEVDTSSVASCSNGTASKCTARNQKRPSTQICQPQPKRRKINEFPCIYCFTQHSTENGSVRGSNQQVVDTNPEDCGAAVGFENTNVPPVDEPPLHESLQELIAGGLIDNPTAGDQQKTQDSQELVIFNHLDVPEGNVCPFVVWVGPELPDFYHEDRVVTGPIASLAIKSLDHSHSGGRYKSDTYYQGGDIIFGWLTKPLNKQELVKHIVADATSANPSSSLIGLFGSHDPSTETLAANAGNQSVSVEDAPMSVEDAPMSGEDASTSGEDAPRKYRKKRGRKTGAERFEKKEQNRKELIEGLHRYPKALTTHMFEHAQSAYSYQDEIFIFDEPVKKAEGNCKSKNFCFYCAKPKSRLSDHVRIQHPGETITRAIEAIPNAKQKKAAYNHL
ncbi:uncharacterized protein LOC132198850 isoform X2 [Neocloeon triangulifer]|uniref:uncharacterized protein LOC132198850 isoform X2 n=1 Tax=Neocloeon triangulifer TaxID=2078957 RepID=UPI00286F99A9|nr:uncharacterized protein LOC132198850 isoform X2 [Neocloeon triangulifer]